MDDAGGQAHDEGRGENVLRPFEEFPGNAVGIVPGSDARKDTEGKEQGRYLLYVPGISESSDNQEQYGEQQHGQDEISHVAPKGKECEDNVAE